MEILSVRLIALISWATRWSMGAFEVTHGQLALGADGVALVVFAAFAAPAADSAASAAVHTAAARHRRYWNLVSFRATPPRFIMPPPTRACLLASVQDSTLPHKVHVSAT
jgi:hypothetical protein